MYMQRNRFQKSLLLIATVRDRNLQGQSPMSIYLQVLQLQLNFHFSSRACLHSHPSLQYFKHVPHDVEISQASRCSYPFFLQSQSKTEHAWDREALVQNRWTKSLCCLCSKRAWFWKQFLSSPFVVQAINQSLHFMPQPCLFGSALANVNTVQLHSQSTQNSLHAWADSSLRCFGSDKTLMTWFSSHRTIASWEERMGLHSDLITVMILRHSNVNAITKGKMRDSVAQETFSNKYYLN